MVGKQTNALEAWVGLLRGHTSLRRSLSAELQHEHGLGITEYEALLLLSRAGAEPLRRVDLADRLGLSPSGVTRLLDGLESVRLVAKETCARDARVSYAVLTDAGRKRLECASRSHVAAIAAAFEARYSREELETLAALLGRLPGAAESDRADCAA